MGAYHTSVESIHRDADRERALVSATAAQFFLLSHHCLTTAVSPVFSAWPTMITPFDEAGHIDYAMLESLTDWYIESGVAGLFAVCLSSEMYDLTDKERISIAKAVYNRAAGRVKVVATGTFGGSIETMAAFTREMSEYCDAVVIVSGAIWP